MKYSLKKRDQVRIKHVSVIYFICFNQYISYTERKVLITPHVFFFICHFGKKFQVELKKPTFLLETSSSTNLVLLMIYLGNVNI
jgi:hypothetical protein